MDQGIDLRKFSDDPHFPSDDLRLCFFQELRRGTLELTRRRSDEKVNVSDIPDSIMKALADLSTRPYFLLQDTHLVSPTVPTKKDLACRSSLS